LWFIRNKMELNIKPFKFFFQSSQIIFHINYAHKKRRAHSHNLFILSSNISKIIQVNYHNFQKIERKLDFFLKQFSNDKVYKSSFV
jgi:hypothetical protein